MKQTVLVTGGTGFIGSHLVEGLLQRGMAVRCLVRRPCKIAGAELARGDLAGGEGLREAAEGACIIFHLGGVTKALAEADYHRVNATGTRNLLAACRTPVRFVYLSSLAAAGPSLDGAPLEEDAEPSPVSEYGRSKLEAEQALRSSPLGQNAVIVRPPVVYGPRDTDVLQVLRMASRGFVFQIGRGDRFFSHVYVDDLVKGLLAAAWSETAAGRTYYIANPEPVTWSAFAHEAGQVMGRTVRTIAAPALLADLAGRVCGQAARIRGKASIISSDKIREAQHRYWICDPSRAARDFGFVARTSLREGLAATVAWYGKAGWLRY